MGKIYNAARGKHDIVVQVMRQPFPQLERMLVEWQCPVQHVVGANQRCIPADIAGTYEVFLQHRHIRDAMMFGKIMCGCKPMPATADNDNVICGFRIRLSPGWSPSGLPVQRIFCQAQNRIISHGKRSLKSRAAMRKT